MITLDEILTIAERNGGRYDGSIDLSLLASAEGLVLPKHVSGSLWLNRITSADGLVLPLYVGRSLWLEHITSAKGVNL